MATDDVYTAKKAFLEAQVRRLASALGPSRDYKAAASSASVDDHDRLSDTMVENAIYKCIYIPSAILTEVNLALRKHHRLQYSSQAIRHVSTQLDELYRSNINTDREIGIQGGEGAMLLDILDGHADLTDPSVISVIPDVWPIQEDDDQQETYEKQVAELQSLCTAITSLRRKQTYYDSILSLAEETLGNPTVDVQPNIVTKTGPITDELRKMRTLLAKVTDHLNNSTIQLSPFTTTEPEEMDIEKWDELTRIINQVNQDGTV